MQICLNRFAECVSEELQSYQSNLLWRLSVSQCFYRGPTELSARKHLLIAGAVKPLSGFEKFNRLNLAFPPRFLESFQYFWVWSLVLVKKVNRLRSANKTMHAPPHFIRFSQHFCQKLNIWFVFLRTCRRTCGWNFALILAYWCVSLLCWLHMRCPKWTLQYFTF